MKPRTCNTCGRALVWAHAEDGTAVPLDARPAVYEVVRYTEADVPIVRRIPGALVNHYSTCAALARAGRPTSRGAAHTRR